MEAAGVDDNGRVSPRAWGAWLGRCRSMIIQAAPMAVMQQRVAVLAGGQHQPCCALCCLQVFQSPADLWRAVAAGEVPRVGKRSDAVNG